MTESIVTECVLTPRSPRSQGKCQGPIQHLQTMPERNNKFCTLDAFKCLICRYVSRLEIPNHKVLAIEGNREWERLTTASRSNIRLMSLFLCTEATCALWTNQISGAPTSSNVLPGLWLDVKGKCRILKGCAAGQPCDASRVSLQNALPKSWMVLEGAAASPRSQSRIRPLSQMVFTQCRV